MNLNLGVQMVKVAHKKSGSISGLYKKRSGFTFIELIVVLMIMAVLAAIIVPRVRYSGTAPLDELIENINKLTRLAYARAIVTGKVHKVIFKMAKSSPEVQVEMAGEETKTGLTPFEPVKNSIIPAKFSWDDRFEIYEFYIKGIEEAHHGSLKDAWFFVMPSGLSQDIIINIYDHETEEERGLVLNPFATKFSIYDTFQTP